MWKKIQKESLSKLEADELRNRCLELIDDAGLDYEQVLDLIDDETFLTPLLYKVLDDNGMDLKSKVVVAAILSEKIGL